nr:hypothetical protein [Tanacetum cinerariifolium]
MSPRGPIYSTQYVTLPHSPFTPPPVPPPLLPPPLPPCRRHHRGPATAATPTRLNTPTHSFRHYLPLPLIKPPPLSLFLFSFGLLKDKGMFVSWPVTIHSKGGLFRFSNKGVFVRRVNNNNKGFVTKGGCSFGVAEGREGFGYCSPQLIGACLFRGHGCRDKNKHRGCLFGLPKQRRECLFRLPTAA